MIASILLSINCISLPVNAEETSNIFTSDFNLKKLDELEKSGVIKTTNYTYEEYYNLLIKEGNYKVADKFKAEKIDKVKNMSNYKQFNNNWVEFVKVVQFRETLTKTVDLLYGMTLDMKQHPTLPIQEIISYIDGTSFIKFDGITTLNFEKDFEPVVRLRSSNGVNYNAAHITCKGTVKGTIRGSVNYPPLNNVEVGASWSILPT